MKKYRPLLVTISLFFLIVEIWEPSTDFVRATITDPGAIVLNHSPTIQKQAERSDGTQLGSSRSYGSMIIDGDSDLLHVPHPDDQGISHSTDGIFIFDLSNNHVATNFISARPDDHLEGYFRVLKNPPILS